jgi:hypothetical protein
MRKIYFLKGLMLELAQDFFIQLAQQRLIGYIQSHRRSIAITIDIIKL